MGASQNGKIGAVMLVLMAIDSVLPCSQT